MLRRLLAVVVLVWALGFVGFAVTLPGPAQDDKTQAVVVLTGGEGRIQRGLAVIERREARIMLVSGVDPEVKPQEFVAEYKVPPAAMKCCVTLGYDSIDTRSNARETAQFVADRKLHSIRLVTSDWHMRRAAYEVRRVLPEDVEIVEDAVPTRPSFKVLLVEYSKYLARRAWAAGAAG